jgi:alpha-tubulin suppressor-like RCC1 family protein
MLAITGAAGGIVITAQAPAAANANSLWVGKIGETHGTFGANAVVRIGGDLQVKTFGCAEDGVNDFVYPTSNVYVVAPGTGAGELTDVTGGRPNTVVQYATMFDDEIIAMTQPGGTLAEGTYDVVFDTCQDGRFDPEEDSIFPNAVTVSMPTTLPAADSALATLKHASHAEYESWKQARTVMNGVWKLVDKAVKGGCKAGNPWACGMKYANYFGPIKKSFDQLLVNQGLHYLAIYEDPPNSDFKHPVLPGASDRTDAMAGEAALTKALLDGIEAYKGAQQAGDAEWALVHARAVRDLHDALAQQTAATRAQLQDLAALFTTQADAGLKDAWDYLGRVRREGLTLQERHTLRDNGMTIGEVTAFESDLAATITPRVLSSDVRAVLDAQRSTHVATATALVQGRAAWQAIVEALEGNAKVADERPVAAFTAPSTVVEGATLTLDGSTSTRATAYAWDLDGDRDFDDATGATPSVTLPDPGTALVGLRVRDAAERTSYAWKPVNVTAVGSAPTVTGTPDQRLQTVVTGTAKEFEVAVSDDSVTPQVAWSVDGEAVGTPGAGLTWTAPTAPGVHQVVATATDADGHTGTFAWDVNVHRPDQDGDGWSSLLDCDETDAAVHPGQTEYLGNGIDDDCNDASPDAPEGGLTGKLFGWGSGDFGRLGIGANSPGNYLKPTPVVLGDDVIQVEAMQDHGYAVLANNTVRAWGQGDGGVGDNTFVTRNSPVQPVGPDGALLSGIRRISASHDHVAATTTTGHVYTWGKQTLGTFGDGSPEAVRPYADFVRTSAGGAPLTGVRSVEAGHAEDYALMKDGTVMAWGQVTCDGTSDGTDPFPKQIAGLTDIKQISTSMAVTLFLKKDGTVLSCGGTDDELGRDWDFTGKSAYRPLPVTGFEAGSKVVDISITGDAAMALKEDGSVYLWGRNTNAVLAPLFGARDGVAKVPTLAPLPAGPPAVDVDNTDSSTPRVIRADGSLVLWGGNTNGAGGTGQAGFITSPIVLDVAGRTVLQTSGGEYTGFALTRPKDDPELELPANWVNATVADADLTESGDGAFAVSLDHALNDDVSLSWSLGAGTAGGGDADLRTGTVVIPAGQTSRPIPVDVIDDQVDEDDETVVLSLTGARLGLTIDRAQAIGTIADDDDVPAVSVDSRSVDEGGTSLTDTPVTFRLSRPSGKTVVATYETVAGSAEEGADFVASTATIRFEPGETEDVVHLAVSGDAVHEPQETFDVNVTAATNAAVGDGGRVRIVDDEALGVDAVGSTTVEGGPVEFVVTINPAPLPGVEVTVPWTFVELAEKPTDEPGDIVAASGTAVLTADRRSVVVSTGSKDDSVIEDPEPVLLEIGDAVSSDARPVVRAELTPAWVADNDKVNQPPVVEVAPAPSGVEGGSVDLDGTVTDDADGASAQWSVTGPCTVAGAGADTSVTCTQNGTYVATLTATDAEGLTAAATTVLTVANAVPVAGAITIDGTGALVEFTDAGVEDTHTCQVVWGDATQEGVMAGAPSPCFLPHAYAPGTWTAKVTVTDSDGESFTEERTVTVAGTTWPWRGFLQPIDNAPAVNVVKAGQSVPIKFGLGGYRGMDIFADGSPSSGENSCGGGELDDVEQISAPGASTLSYDASTDTYQYVWKTKKEWAGKCRRLVVELADGTSHWAEFKLR